MEHEDAFEELWSDHLDLPVARLSKLWAALHVPREFRSDDHIGCVGGDENFILLTPKGDSPASASRVCVIDCSETVVIDAEQLTTRPEFWISPETSFDGDEEWLKVMAFDGEEWSGTSNDYSFGRNEWVLHGRDGDDVDIDLTEVKLRWRKKVEVGEEVGEIISVEFGDSEFSGDVGFSISIGAAGEVFVVLYGQSITLLGRATKKLDVARTVANAWDGEWSGLVAISSETRSLPRLQELVRSAIDMDINFDDQEVTVFAPNLDIQYLDATDVLEMTSLPRRREDADQTPKPTGLKLDDFASISEEEQLSRIDAFLSQMLKKPPAG